MAYYRKRRGVYRRKARKGMRRGGMKRLVKRVLYSESETKYSAPTANIAQAIVFGGILHNFHQSPYFVQGVFGQTGYIGSTITNRRLALNYYIQAGDDTNQVRVIIGWSKKTLSLADIQTAVPSPLAPWRQTVKKALILYDKLHMVDTNGDEGQQDCIVRRLNISLRNMKTVFEGSSGPNVYGHLFMYVMSDSSAVPNPSIDFNYVLSYKDV